MQDVERSQSSRPRRLDAAVSAPVPLAEALAYLPGGLAQHLAFWIENYGLEIFKQLQDVDI